jgi:hypothetical protein
VPKFGAAATTSPVRKGWPADYKKPYGLTAGGSMADSLTETGALWLVRRIGLAALLLIGLAGPASSAGDVVDPTRARAAIVIDSSEAMYAPLDTFRKYYLIRKALYARASAVPAGLPTILVAYGHRPKLACTDVEALVPLEAFDAQHMLKAVLNIRPHGSAPLAEALKAAASALGEPSGMSERILLIAAAGDNCDGDPCAAAGELAAKRPDLTIDVLAVGPANEDVPALRCIADRGRGKLTLVTTSDSLEPALTSALQSLSSPTRSEPKPATIVATAPQDKPLLRLSAKLSAESGPYARPVSWTVRKNVATGGEGTIVYQGSSATPTIPVDEGTYSVTAKLGDIAAIASADAVLGRPTDVSVVLNAGILRIKLSDKTTDENLSDVTLALHRRSAGAYDIPMVFSIGQVEAAGLPLPPGDYQIFAERGDMRVEQAAKVEAGKEVEAVMSLATGTLHLEASNADGVSITDGIYFFVSEDDPDAPSGHRDISRTAVAAADFQLPPGVYHVTLRQGDTESQTDATVNAGITTRLVVPSASGTLDLTTQLPTGLSVSDDQFSCATERAGGVAGYAIRTSRAHAVLQMAAGQYHVSCRIGSANATASADVTIQVGRTAKLSLQPQAGLLTLHMKGPTIQPGEQFWQIMDRSNRIVWSSASAEREVLLAPGDYRVGALQRGRSQSLDFTISNNQKAFVEIPSE